MSSRIPIQRPGLSLQKLDDEHVLVDESGSMLIYVNNTASVVWQLCDGIRSEKALIDILNECFPEASDTLAADVFATLTRLANQSAIVYREENGSAESEVTVPVD